MESIIKFTNFANRKQIKPETMKRMVFLFIASLVAHYSALAETILPFVQDGKVWVYDVSNFIYDWEETFSLEGDTLIGTRNCLKLYYTCQVYGQEHVYRGAMFYKSSGNVYFIAPGSTTPVLMYDFASEPGTIINVGPFELKINEKKLVKYHGEYLKAIDYSPIEREGFEGQWIDGVGIISGGNLTQLVEGNATWATGGERQLKTCAVNGEVVFEWNDFHSSSQIVTEIEEYYPEGTKWTEIRLDTLKYNSWYSKVGDDWVPNFETIEYYVQGEYTDKHYVLKKVYTNGPEWTDSLTLLISNGESYGNSNCIFVKIPENQGDIICPSEIYQFDWSVGKRLWFQNMLEANTTCFPPCGLFNYGIIDEIKEGDFGGVRPLKYVDLSGKAPIDPERPWLDYADTNGGRIIQGIGITEWNDGECLFGPPDPYYAGYGWRGDYKSRHYRSMLVHFERNNEVLYDVWPKKETPSGITIKDSQTASQGTLFDLQGRKLQSKPARGIYIEDGKKKIVK